MERNDRVLKDFDWQLNLALSSDKLATLNQSLLKIDFDFSTKIISNDSKCLEMNADELSLLVSALKNANQALQQTKT